MPHQNKVDLIVVVNGRPVEVGANIHAPLRALIDQALDKSGNSGQPIENWELRDAGGTILVPERKLEEFSFPEGTKLFLNLKAGIGG